MDCFGTYFTHAQSCDNVRVPSATEWTASVHTSHMPKAVIMLVFQVLYRLDCFGTYFTHAQSCDNVRVQSASGHMLNFLRFRFFAFPRFRAFAFLRFPVFAFSSFRVFAFSHLRFFVL